MLGWDGVPSPIAFIALILNWYVRAAFKFSNTTYRALADIFVSSVTQSTSGSNTDWVSAKVQIHHYRHEYNIYLNMCSH